MGVTFIVFHKNGTREQYHTHYSEDDEHEVDAAWDEMLRGGASVEELQ